MSFDLADTLDLLQRTPGVLTAWLAGSSEAWHARDEGDGTWSPLLAVGHLIHGEETDWVPRARIVLEHGDAVPFEPFDREAQRVRFAGWSLDDLLDRFEVLRQANVETVRGWRLTDGQLALPGRHPALGAVTLRQLLATWAAHDLNHLAQIARVMAKRHAEAVGPWKEYLGIFHWR